MSDADYICLRVVDALLREDVAQCVSRGEIVVGAALPDCVGPKTGPADTWLRITHWPAGELCIPVVAERFMQPWRIRCLPMLAIIDGVVEPVARVERLLDLLASAVGEASVGHVDAFRAECQTAVAHRGAAEAERARWFTAWRESMPRGGGTDLPEWHARMLHYDRLASFLDHPFYPTARAKVGFAVDDLRRYAPEFGPAFELRWLAVPRSSVHGQSEADLPGWPSFSDVGLAPGLAEDFQLIPVHPFLWDASLEALLAAEGLTASVHRAPRPWLRVIPTLSVRTVAVCQAPDWHIKLPLTICTLGARNVRTIKPSTIRDGDTIQRLLSRIVAAEPTLSGRVLLTREDVGAHVEHKPFLGYIVRRYPVAEIATSTLVPVAALLAPTPSGGCVIEELADRFHGGDVERLLDEYLELTLRVHLRLWVRHRIALESNQQNSVVVLDDGRPLRLLLKDNDAARVHRRTLATAPAPVVLADERIVVDGDLPLAQMFITITLQLNVAPLIEDLSRRFQWRREERYAAIRRRIARILDELAADGEDVASARDSLLVAERLPAKHLLAAASLLDKRSSGAADVNKHYGLTAPNFLRQGA